jgi:DNA polymerase-1
LSSNDPNLQNIPIRSEIGNQIRGAFKAPEGYAFISLDYSQFELRIIADLSGDKQLQQVFLDGRDIHDEVSKKLGIDRRAAKAINFGIVYGLSAFGLSQSLKIDPKIAKEYIDAYFENYPKLADYLKKTKEEVKEKGYVETLYGRRRELPDIHAANAILRNAAERMAINAPAQGTEADLMKVAMIQAQIWLDKTYGDLPSDKRPYLLLQIHDSLLLEAPNALVKEVAENMKRIMEDVDKQSVPLTVDVSVGPDWGHLEKIKD